ncbi:MAG: hypothetical protein ACRCX2_28000 [Paraclostridium sp.]
MEKIVRTIVDNSIIAVEGLCILAMIFIGLTFIYLVLFFIFRFGVTLDENVEYIDSNKMLGVEEKLLIDGIEVNACISRIYFWIYFFKGLKRLITFQIPIFIVIFSIFYAIGKFFR